jgi:hypothetical protein
MGLTMYDNMEEATEHFKRSMDARGGTGLAIEVGKTIVFIPTDGSPEHPSGILSWEKLVRVGVNLTRLDEDPDEIDRLLVTWGLNPVAIRNLRQKLDDEKRNDE